MARTIVDGGFEAYYSTRTQPAPRPSFSTDFSMDNDSGECALILEGVRCGACLWLIEQVLRRQAGVTRADVNYTTQRARVSWDVSRAGLAPLIAAIRAVGYDASPYDPRREEELRRRERRTALWRLFVAGFGAMQVMMYAFPAYIGDGELSSEASQLMRWASLVITAPVLAFACAPFFSAAWRELRTRRIGLDTPIALGLAGGFAASAWATLTGSGEVYFDSISMLAFLLLGARYVHMVATRRAAASLDRLMRWAPAAALKPGERVRVAPGERVPADGIVEEGVSSADESLLTGESRPLPKQPGDPLLAGSINFEQPLVLRVTRAGADTQAAAIARLADRAAAEKPQLVESADRVARYLTFVVIVTALVAALHAGNVWLAVAVLVATCPCALALAAPVVLTRANAWLLGRGALVTRSSVYQALERVTDVVLDKTGTLTTGRPALLRIATLGQLREEACLALARSLEVSSRHPVSRAFGDGPMFAADEPRNFPGQGIEARVAGRRTRIGAVGFCQELARIGPPVPSDGCSVFLSDEQGWVAAFELQDAVRPEAAALVADLRERGIEVHLASGDRAEAGAGLARLLWIERFTGGMAPQDKCDYVERLQAAGRVVAMVGDGLNDAPVLARADVSFAMGSGADAAQLRADVVLTGNRLGAITEALETSRRAMGLMRSSFAWALAYNAAVLPAAALGWIGPWEAALGMAASSALVLLNASRPMALKQPWKASTSSSRSPSYSYS